VRSLILDSTTSKDANHSAFVVSSRISAPRAAFPSALVQPFTLAPAHRGGRIARKGYSFQDWWIAYSLLGSLSESDGFAYARIEGVEDLDLIVRREDSWVEQYVQVKSKEEGTGNWTTRSLEEQEILPSFFRLFKEFRASPHDASRDIELLLVVEGDLGRDVRQLKQGSKEGREFLFSILTCIEINETSAAYQPSIRAIRDFFRNSASKLLAGASISEQVIWDELSHKIAIDLHLAHEEIRDTLSKAAASAAAVLDEFLNALVFQSRAPGIELLEEAAIKRLMGTADIGILEAEGALARLVQRIADESSKLSPTLIDKSVLLSWLGLRPKPSLRSKPEVVSDYIERAEFSEKFSKTLANEQFVLLYGLSKIGKSQFGLAPKNETNG